MSKSTPAKINFEKLADDFPTIKKQLRPGVNLVYLDSAATSQKPLQVIEAMNKYYRETNANIHRGIHTLAEEATAAYKLSRKKIADFIGAQSKREIIFTRNTTESINLVARTWGRINLQKNDLVILTEMEHHSNIVPWQMLAQETGIILKFIPVNPDGFLDLEEYQRLLDQKPKLVSFMHMSNVLGTINPAQEIIRKAHEAGALALLDGAQSVPHFPVNVAELNPDFMAFSAHKMSGPTGIGVLYGKEHLLEAMPPFLGGGDMIKRVTLNGFTSNELPYKFEAGTPAIAEAIGFGAAVDYLTTVGMENIYRHEKELITYTLESLSEIPGLEIIGKSYNERGGVASFVFPDIHPHDVSTILDQDGIAVRAGHHCAMPLHQKFNLPATTRASLYLYNTRQDIDQLVKSLYKVKNIFG